MMNDETPAEYTIKVVNSNTESAVDNICNKACLSRF